MRRGDIVTVVAPGDFGKPRPAVIIQGDSLNRAEPGSTIVALMTSSLRDAPLLRLTIDPSRENGLEKRSQIQTNRILTLKTDRIGTPIGRLSDNQTVELNRLLARKRPANPNTTPYTAGFGIFNISGVRFCGSRASMSSGCRAFGSVSNR